MKRNAFSADFKAKVAIEAIKGHRTVSELVSEFGVHATQINTWKKQLLKESVDIFKKGRKHREQDQEAEKDRLYRQVGKLRRAGVIRHAPNLRPSKTAQLHSIALTD